MPNAPSERKKKVIFILLTGALTLGLLELVSMVGLSIFDWRSGIEAVSFPRDQAYYENLWRSQHLVWDREIGWDQLHPVRGGTHIVRGEADLASSYGDSFTFCEDVDDDQTWQHVFTQLSGRRMLNMGINAAGTDQAYFKLLKYYKTYPTKVVILGILPENIIRNVGIFGCFYLRHRMPFVKPRMMLTQGGEVTLQPNPIQTPQMLTRLAEPELRRQIAGNDFWYHLYKERYGFDLISGRSFPSLPQALTLVRGLYRYGLEPADYHYFYRREGSEPLRIMKHIILLFAARASEHGFTPIIVLHCESQDLGHPDFIRPFISFIRDEAGIQVFDVMSTFMQETKKNRLAPEKLYAGGHHYSAQGNRIVGRELVRFFGDRGLLTGGPPPRPPPVMQTH